MSKFVATCDWSEVPHISAKEQEQLLASIPPYQRDARSKGVPQLGSGAVYGFPESEIKVANFEIPKHWPRGFGMDAGGGAKPTAAVWGALDRDSSTLYIYDAYKRESPEPAIHSDAIKARGQWIPGVGDCASLILTAHDAEQLINTYKRLGLDLELPDKSVETGITEVWELLSASRFKVFASCQAWFEEYRLYRRDDKGRIVKSKDHLMDSTRYLVRSGRARMKTQPLPKGPPKQAYQEPSSNQGWMA